MKKILAIAVATAFAAPAIATADTTLYGKLNAELTSVKSTGDMAIDDPNNVVIPGTLKNSNMMDKGSRIGIKGSTPLSGGMAATYKLEQGLEFTDHAGGVITGGGARQSYVGLKSSYGEFRFGSQYGPTKLSSGKAEMFGDQLGDYNNIITGKNGSGQSIESPVNNAVAYVNKFGNVGVAIANTASHEANGSFVTGSKSAWDGMVNYSNNGMYAALGYQKVKDLGATTRLTGAYKFPAGHKVALVHEQSKADAAGSTKQKGTLISGGYKMGNMMLKAQYGQRDEGAATKKKMTAIGLDYKLGKKTKLMAEYAITKNGATLNDDVTITQSTTEEKGFGMGISHSF